MLGRIRKTTTPPLDLDALFARNRTLYGDTRMEGEGTGGDGGAGGGGDGGEGSRAGTGTATGTGGGAGTGEGAGQTNGQNGSWDGKVESLPEPVQKMIGDLRKEAAGNRTKATEVETKQQEMLDGIAKALGLKGEEQADPAKLQASIAEKDTALTAAQATIATQTIELAAWRSAGKAGADTSALLDSRSFVDAASKLDPEADDFQTKLDAAIKKAVEDNPKLRAAQAAGRGGSEFPGGPGSETKPNSLFDAVAGKMAGSGAGN